MDFDGFDLDLAMSEMNMEMQANMADPYFASIAQAQEDSGQSLLAAMSNDFVEGVEDIGKPKNDISFTIGWDDEPEDEVMATGYLPDPPDEPEWLNETFDWTREGLGDMPHVAPSSNPEEFDEDDKSCRTITAPDGTQYDIPTGFTLVQQGQGPFVGHNFMTDGNQVYFTPYYLEIANNSYEAAVGVQSDLSGFLNSLGIGLDAPPHQTRLLVCYWLCPMQYCKFLT